VLRGGCCDTSSIDGGQFTWTGRRAGTLFSPCGNAGGTYERGYPMASEFLVAPPRQGNRARCLAGVSAAGRQGIRAAARDGAITRRSGRRPQHCDF